MNGSYNVNYFFFTMHIFGVIIGVPLKGE